MTAAPCPARFLSQLKSYSISIPASIEVQTSSVIDRRERFPILRFKGAKCQRRHPSSQRAISPSMEFSAARNGLSPSLTYSFPTDSSFYGSGYGSGEAKQQLQGIHNHPTGCR